MTDGLCEKRGANAQRRLCRPGAALEAIALCALAIVACESHDHDHDHDHDHSSDGMSSDLTLSETACSLVGDSPVSATAHPSAAMAEANRLGSLKDDAYLISGPGFISFDIPAEHLDFLFFSTNPAPFRALSQSGLQVDLAVAKADGLCPTDLPFRLSSHAHSAGSFTAELSGVGPYWIAFMNTASDHTPSSHDKADGGIHSDGGPHIASGHQPDSGHSQM